MSLLGKDFEDAMQALSRTLAQATRTLVTAEATIDDLRQAVAKLNALVERIQIKP